MCIRDSRTIELFCGAVKNAGTVVWNGPMGVFEFERFVLGRWAAAQGAVYPMFDPLRHVVDSAPRCV